MTLLNIGCVQMGKEFPLHMSFDKYSNLKGVEVVESQPLHNEAEYLVSLLFIFSSWRQAKLHRYPLELETSRKV